MNELINVIFEFRKYVEFQIVSNDNPKYKEIKNKVLNYLSTLSKTRLHDIQDMVPALYKVYDTLNGKYAKLYLPKSEIDYFHKHVYSFFAKGCGIHSPAKYFQYLPTKLFEEFIKGITFFRKDETNVISNPLYHRIKACGSKDIESISKFVHNKTDTPETKRVKTKSLRTCIIERQIYDKIYSTILNHQDIGHKHELQSLEQLYLDLTSTTLKTDVHFKQNFRPFHVMVRTYRKHSLIDIESYDKRSDGTVIVEKYKDRPTYRTLMMSSPRKYDRRVDIQTYTDPPSQSSSSTKKGHTI